MKFIRQLELLFPGSQPTERRTGNSVTRRRRNTLKEAKNNITSSHYDGELRVGHDALSGDTHHPQHRVAPRVPASDDFLLTVWRNLRREFFPEHPQVDDYAVSWSSRPQKRVLASCNIRRRRIVVAQELFEPSASRWIAPVLYHEMCHAVIGEGVHLSESGRRLWHGRQFRQLEARHPDIVAMNAWIATGGWAMAVRSNRARVAWRARHRPRQ